MDTLSGSGCVFGLHNDPENDRHETAQLAGKNQ
jgi:hypothetical protein